MSIDNIFHENRLFSPAMAASERSRIDSLQAYQEKYRASIESPEAFWAQMAENFAWFKKWQRVRRHRWDETIEVAWFEGAETNVAFNALDRHLPTRQNKPALLWEGNRPGEAKSFTYAQLHDEVGRLANALKSLGVRRGDRVALYLGMVPELAIALLACARIGAVHNVIFGGFSAEALKDRILDCQAKALLTADGLFRGDKTVPLKTQVDQALALCEAAGHAVSACLVLKRTGQEVSFQRPRDHWWHEVLAAQSGDCPCEVMQAEDPLFVLYTSGSTGKPKGVLHTTAGYMVYVGTTFDYVFDYREDDVFWCTADVGWVTGHSYLVYGPLLNGATVLMFEGVPHYPAPDRLWQIIAQYRVSVFYTAPTLIRALMKEGDSHVERHDLSSLRLLGTVGEPINPEAWVWYFEVIGKQRCPIVDTWWQTETGGIMVTPWPGAMPLKPGSAGLPFFGVRYRILRDDGTDCDVDEGGYFVIEAPWPSMLRSVYGQPERLRQTYFSQFPGFYFSGDGARRDRDGYLWFLGRVDDVLNVSGHRLGTAELESALAQHTQVAEAAVVGFPHSVKGQGVYAFVVLHQAVQPDRGLRRELIQHIAYAIGPIAKPDHIQFVKALPKTRSGKVMRRLLRQIASGESTGFGDLSTLSDPAVIRDLLESSRVERYQEGGAE